MGKKRKPNAPPREKQETRLTKRSGIRKTSSSNGAAGRNGKGKTKSDSIKSKRVSGTSGAGKDLQLKKKTVVVPFERSDRILLVGEGDFSFALSLVRHHRCRFITATCYDSEEALYEKYPQAKGIVDMLLNYDGSRDASGRDLHRMNDGAGDGGLKLESADCSSSPPEWSGLSSPSTAAVDGEDIPSLTKKLSSVPEPELPNPYPQIQFHASISATKLASYKAIRRSKPYTKIVFNFPHVGGLSTDVNRQVRANQELLVAFFRSCKGLLTAAGRDGMKRNGKRKRKRKVEDESDSDASSTSSSSSSSPADPADHAANTTKPSSRPGQVVITLFEAAPYTLWNIRDLGRHSGFRLVTSFRFVWEAYPGYRHARTLGTVRRRQGVGAGSTNGHGEGRDGGEEGEDGRGGDDGGDEEEERGGRRGGFWRGEERDARTYVFEVAEQPGDVVGDVNHDTPWHRNMRR